MSDAPEIRLGRVGDVTERGGMDMSDKTPVGGVTSSGDQTPEQETVDEEKKKRIEDVQNLQSSLDNFFESGDIGSLKDSMRLAGRIELRKALMADKVGELFKVIEGVAEARGAVMSLRPPPVTEPTDEEGPLTGG